MAVKKKIVRNQTKIDGNRGLGWSWGLLGEALGAIWAPKAVWHRRKEPNDQKITASGLPFWDPFSTFPLFFNVFLRFFYNLRFDGYQDHFFMEVDYLLMFFFISFRIVGK
jgi:hypothetical protein